MIQSLHGLHDCMQSAICHHSNVAAQNSNSPTDNVIGRLFYEEKAFVTGVKFSLGAVVFSLCIARRPITQLEIG